MQTLTIRVFESTGFSKNPVKNPVKTLFQCFLILSFSSLSPLSSQKAGKKQL